MFTEAFPILSTRDLPRLLEFYQGLLGFTETYRFPAEGRPAYVSLRLGDGSQLGIAEDPAAAGPSARFELCVYAHDCDAAVGHLRGHGVKVTQEPADMPWGERAARVTDPDGNRLLLLSAR